MPVTSIPVDLAGTATGYTPPGGPVPADLRGHGWAEHRAPLAVVLAVEHRGVAGRRSLSAEHRAPARVLVGRSLLDREHRAPVQALAAVAGGHRGVAAVLTGRSRMSIEHRAPLALAVAVRHAAVVAALAGRSLVSVAHRARLAVGLAREHRGVIAVPTVSLALEHRAQTEILVGRTRVAVRQAAPTEILAGRSRVSIEHGAPLAVALAGGHAAAVQVCAARAGEHRAPLRLPPALAGEHRAAIEVWPYTLVAAGHRASVAVALAAGHRAPADFRGVVDAGHRAPAGFRGVAGAEHRAPLMLAVTTAREHRAPAAVRTYNVAGAGHRAPVVLLEATRVRVLDADPRLLHRGRTLAIVGADLTAAEASPTWLATVDLADPADYAGVSCGDPVTLTLGGESWSLIVDGREMERQHGSGRLLSLRLTAVSPLAWRGQPWAPALTRTWDGPADARSVVEELVGPVDWSLPDWSIPAGALAADGADPLALARSIAAAAGGVLESRPDGGVVARPRYPVPVPDWASAAAGLVLTDADTVSVSEALDPIEICNRVTVSDGAATRPGDRVEYEPDADDALSGTIRVWPVPWRTARVVHTGDAGAVTLTPTGEEIRERIEVIAIEGGRGQTRYPVWQIQSVDWQHRDLGAVTASPDSRELAAGVAGWSLLRCTYTTRCQTWRAAHVRAEDVLFLVY